MDWVILLCVMHYGWVCALVIFFFFYGYSDHLDLHSFPTRRSSDLYVAAARQVARLAVGSPNPRVSSVKYSDRKSTRLNSSHITISYAVFCLKKKITALATARGTTESARVVRAWASVCTRYDRLRPP